jgi:hypothetical protein
MSLSGQIGDGPPMDVGHTLASKGAVHSPRQCVYVRTVWWKERTTLLVRS